MEIREVRREIWDKYVSKLEYDVHGAQVYSCKMMKYLKKAEKDNMKENNTSEEDRLEHCRSLCFSLKEVMNNSPREKYMCVGRVIYREKNEILKTFQNSKVLTN
jgi:hypothetical protein